VLFFESKRLSPSLNIHANKRAVNFPKVLNDENIDRSLYSAIN